MNGKVQTGRIRGGISAERRHPSGSSQRHSTAMPLRQIVIEVKS